VAIIVIVSTLPVVIPFMVFSDVKVALQVSNGLPLGTHFLGGWIFGRYGHGNPWRDGLKMVAVGAVLVAAIIVFGG
jgi:VIT1/CCC1 family predicted Fe2+/Mn2+ transporter